MNTRKKSMIMLAVGALLIVMAVGYAAASTMLSITGTANVNATWNIAITGVDEGTPKGNAQNKSTPSFTGTTANFDFIFSNPGDEIKYDITVTNSGTIDAYLTNVNRVSYASSSNIEEKTTTGIDGLSVYYTGIKQDEPIKKGETRTISVVYRLDNSEVVTDTAFESKFGLTFYFGQSKVNNTYKVNDALVLSDNNKYRVLKDNGETVTVIKETPIDDLSIYDSTYSISGVKNYLNTTYKESLDATLSDKIVGNIEVPNYMDYDNQSKSDSDTKYISGFLYDVVSNCYHYQGSSNAGRNCDLGWIATGGKEISQIGQGESVKLISVRPADMYMTMDGTKSVTDAVVHDENSKDTGEKTNFEFNNTNPLIEGNVNLIDTNGTITKQISPINNIIVYNEKIYYGNHQGSIQPYSPEHLYLYPVMTVKKTAIK